MCTVTRDRAIELTQESTEHVHSDKGQSYRINTGVPEHVHSDKGQSYRTNTGVH